MTVNKGEVIRTVDVGNGSFIRLWKDLNTGELELELDTGLSSMFLNQDELNCLSTFLSCITFSVEI